jgi:D-alanine-D-alanine ligase
MWQTAEGFDGGMLFIGNLDIPVDLQFPAQSFRRDPEWLYGEGVGSSRAPLVMLEFALRSLRSMRRLRHLPIGVLYYVDEGLDARYSADVIREAAARSTEVFVLRPGLSGDKIVTHRRGQRTYRLRVEGEPVRLGRFARKKDTLRWVWSKLEAMAALTSQRRRLSIATVKVETEQLPMRLPHRVTASIVANYPTTAAMEAAEAEMQRILAGEGPDWEFDVDSDRPPFVERAAGLKLADEYKAVGRRWDVALERESSAWPSVAGLVPADTACICGIGPVATDLRTPREAVHRLSLVQRTLLLAELLAERLHR